MSILGSLIVELQANTASFIAGMTGASKTARTVGREIEGAFSSLGNVAATALAPFGQVGSMVALTLGQVGSSAGTAIQALGKFGGGIAPLAVGLGAVAGGMAAISAGSIGLAVHTAEAIAKMSELAQSSGVSVESLSALAFAGKSVGIETESMAKIIQKMDKAVLAAATSPGHTANAFTRLHVAVKDASGAIRPATDIMADLAGKFAAMPDGVTKTALALQIFGRGGAQIIPLLNRGSDGIREMTDTAKALGVVIDSQTAAAAVKFKEDLVTIEAAGQGAAISLTKDLLPALDFLAEKLVTSFKTGGAQNLIDWFARITKATIAIGETFFTVFEYVGFLLESTGGAVIKLFNAIGAGVIAAGKAVTFDFSGAKAELAAGYAGLLNEGKNFARENSRIWQENRDFINGVFAPQKTLPVRPSGTGKADTAPAKEDTTLARIQERIKALAQETLDWANLASAGTQAEALIEEAIKKGNAEFGKLRDEASKDKTGAALPFVLQNEAMIKAAGAASVYGAAIKAVLGELDKQGIKFGEQVKVAIELAEAYRQGGAAVAAAAIEKQLEKEIQEAKRLADTYAELKSQSDLYISGKAKLGGAVGPVEGLQVSPETLDMAKRGADQAADALAKLKDEAIRLASSNLSAELAKQSHEFVTLKPYVDALNAAYFKSEDAIRAARVQMELAQFAEEQLSKGVDVKTATVDLKDEHGNITETITLLERKRRILEETDRQSYESSIKQAAAQYDLNRQYDEQIVKLQRVREAVQENGSSTLLVDARLFEAQQQLTHQWDEAAFKVGTFGEKAKGILNEIAIEGQNAGKKISEAFLSAYDSFSGALAKLATGQKANFKQIFQNLAEQVTKAEIQKGIGAIAGKLGLHIPGLAAKADGSSTNPFHVVIDQGGGVLGKGGDKGGLLGGLFGGKADGSQSKPFYVISSSGGGLFGGGSSGGRFGGLFGSLFGGGGNSSINSGGFGDASNFGADVAGLAGGGDVTPGHAYLVGEKHPEFFVPGQSGRVTPKLEASGHQTSITNNFNGLKDTDMFRRSTAQMVAHQHRQMSIAYARS
jgi:hypothetical protein